MRFYVIGLMCLSTIGGMLIGVASFGHGDGITWTIAVICTAVAPICSFVILEEKTQ